MLALRDDFLVAVCHNGPVSFENIQLKILKDILVLRNQTPASLNLQDKFIPTSKENLVSIKSIALSGAPSCLLNGNAYFTSR